MEEVRLIDANALHKRIEMNLHASNPFTIEECCYKDALNSVDEAPTIDGVAGKLFIRNFTRTHGTTQSEKTEKFRNAMYPEAEN